MYHLILVSI